jgi:hypothetical protein
MKRQKPTAAVVAEDPLLPFDPTHLAVAAAAVAPQPQVGGEPAETPAPAEPTESTPSAITDPWQAIVRKLLIEVWAQQTFGRPHERTEENMLRVATIVRGGVDVDALAGALAALVPHGAVPAAEALADPVFRLTPFLHRRSRDALIAALAATAQRDAVA